MQRSADHSYGRRHTLQKFFPRFTALLETARRGMQCARQICNFQIRRSAGIGHGRRADGVGERFLELPLVFRKCCPRQRGTGTHQVGGIHSQRSYEPPRPIHTGGDQAGFQTILGPRQRGDGCSQLAAQGVSQCAPEQLLFIGKGQIKTLPGHAGSTGDIVHGCFSESKAGKDAHGSIEQRRNLRFRPIREEGRGA